MMIKFLKILEDVYITYVQFHFVWNQGFDKDQNRTFGSRKLLCFNGNCPARPGRSRARKKTTVTASASQAE